MIVRVRGAGFLKKYVPPGEMEIPDGLRYSELPVFLKLPGKHPLVYIVDGSTQSDESEIREGDSILLISLLSGG